MAPSAKSSRGECARGGPASPGLPRPSVPRTIPAHDRHSVTTERMTWAENNERYRKAF